MEIRNQGIDYLKINLASPQKIKGWAEKPLPTGEIIGEVTEPSTVDYVTFTPEPGGLFCQRIFGPIKDWECSCGRYKLKNHKNRPTYCEKCGVSITKCNVRRHRMGYIELGTSAIHIWYLKGSPSYLSAVLALSTKKIERIVYEDRRVSKEDYFSIDGISNSEKELRGAELLHEELKEINLKNEIEKNRDKMFCCNSENRVATAVKRIRILESFLITDTKPEWMILSVLPVLPAGLRPIVKVGIEKFATADLNELYSRVVTRNKRLKRLLAVCAPSIIINTEKRLVQEAIDALIDNGKQGEKILGLNRRPLKSLSDIIEGKQGRFRHNLLGKRVDFSGRSVIIVGPQLKLNQCGLPYEMAIELFLPFLIYKVLSQGFAHTILKAKRIIYNNKKFSWYLTETILRQHPVILNRAPTLHRLGIQAFDPVLVKGRAIQLHPLVCPAFNADFDGDQMAVHIPLSFESQLETRLCLLAPNNFLSPSTGEPNIQPAQDMILGFYYLTAHNRLYLKGENHYFSNFNEVISAYEQKELQIHSSIWVRCSEDTVIDTELLFKKTISLSKSQNLHVYNDLQRKETVEGQFLVQYLRTTPGRIIFNQYVNDILNN